MVDPMVRAHLKRNILYFASVRSKRSSIYFVNDIRLEALMHCVNFGIPNVTTTTSVTCTRNRIVSWHLYLKFIFVSGRVGQDSGSI
ncbi:hypothetical protein PILCRDRAFT_719649 [Piloderma croceum F 1598]|uniref:Uncharacterized protein n=1 Tax=Piloderma croceum (strain F 1598) TaxID=765440 RepID=A0A0C3EME2_PILCF|nr:hypothetical protein PILCRDRAFT_719649 [Piloderma croceum F 1598]